MALTKCKIEFKKRDVQLKDIPKFYQELVENKVSVGVHKEQGSFNVKKALWNEFGVTPYVLATPKRKRLFNGSYVTLGEGTTIQIPARPFIRLYLFPESRDLIHKSYIQSINSNFRDGLKTPRSSAKNVLNTVGDAGQVSQWINMERWKSALPNASLTVAIKGFDYPLFETGSLQKAIRYKLSKRTSAFSQGTRLKGTIV